jgi:hypothetical protein
MPVGRMVHGRDGRTLEDVWGGSPRAHLGSTVAGFPKTWRFRRRTARFDPAEYVPA